jgi:hypothetical protein
MPLSLGFWKWSRKVFDFIQGHFHHQRVFRSGRIAHSDLAIFSSGPRPASLALARFNSLECPFQALLINCVQKPRHRNRGIDDLAGFEEGARILATWRLGVDLERYHQHLASDGLLAVRYILCVVVSSRLTGPNGSSGLQEIISSQIRTD